LETRSGKGAMSARMLFVDLENVQKVDLSKVPEDAGVIIFYGVTQKNLPEDLVVQAQPLGARLKWIKIAGQGPNALDFHIAYYLGATLTVSPKTHCFVLSKDTGFDPLIRHLHALGHACRRVGSLKDAFPAPMAKTAIASPPDDYARLVALLKKEKVLPLKRKGLGGKVKSWFLKLGATEHQALVQRLIDEGLVKEIGTEIKFSL
jgi:hypothetical protein